MKNKPLPYKKFLTLMLTAALSLSWAGTAVFADKPGGTRAVNMAAPALTAYDQRSLQDALNAARASDTITVARDIQLTGPMSWDLPAISVTMESADDGHYTITSAAGSRHLNITSTGPVSVTFKGVTLDGGGKSGGILATSSPAAAFYPVTLIGAKIENCYAPNEPGGGVSGSNITLNDCTITGNVSGVKGGGIFATYNSTINGGIISGNQAPNQPPPNTQNLDDIGKGGGVYAGSAVTVTGGQILDNTASEYGGGIYCGYEMVLHDGLIEGNRAGVGGGIGTYSLTMNGGTITRNKVVPYETGGGLGGDYGGGIYTISTATLNGGEISHNTAGEQGNVSNGAGGGLYAQQSATITSNEVKIFGNSAVQGGGIYTQRLHADGGEIHHNTAISGGGISTGQLTMNGGDVHHNQAYSDNMSFTEVRGGGIVAGSFFEESAITNSKIYGNETDGPGGGLFAYDGITLDGCQISGNTSGQGGGIYFADNGYFTWLPFTRKIIGSTVAGNTASAGGGIYCSPSRTSDAIPLEIGSTTISGNQATANSGGGIYVEKLDTLADALITHSDTKFSSNTAAVGWEDQFDAAYLRAKYPGIQYATTSIGDHPLNNLDINYEPAARYALTYHANGGLGGPYVQHFVTENSMVQILDLAATGITAPWEKALGSWNESPDGTGRTYTVGERFNLDHLHGDASLNAQWVDAFTVSFDENYENAPAATQKPVVSPATTVDELPPDPIRTGHQFQSWNTQPDGGGITFTAATPVTSSLTVFAQWKANDYTVEFESDGGSPADSQIVPYGGKVTLPPNPTKSSHTFAGWHRDAGLTQRWNFGADVVTENLILYAKWTYIPANGGGKIGLPGVAHPSAPVPGTGSPENGSASGFSPIGDQAAPPTDPSDDDSPFSSSSPLTGRLRGFAGVGIALITGGAYMALRLVVSWRKGEE